MIPSEPGSAREPDNGKPAPARSGGLATWQKVVGVIGLAVVVLLAILLASGDHGPGRHGPGGQESPADVEDSAVHDPTRWSH